MMNDVISLFNIQYKMKNWLKDTMRTNILLFTFLILFSCGKTVDTNKVFYSGALKNFMHKGDISAKIDLKDIESIPHLYAIGAAENLKGEIIIINGQPIISKDIDDQLILDRSFDHKASLLVYAGVENWNSVDIPDHILTMEELEHYVDQIAAEKGINTEEPFPFLVEGKVASVDWHVIDWDENDNVHTHEKHVNSGLNGTLTNVDVSILGFYSKHHHTIFTHHTTNMHLHVVANNNQIAGHLDNVVLSSGMILKLMEN